MAKNPPHEVAVGDVSDGTAMGEVANALVARGRAVVDRVPAAADRAREAFADAQDTVNRLSEMGVVAAGSAGLINWLSAEHHRWRRKISDWPR